MKTLRTWWIHLLLRLYLMFSENHAVWKPLLPRINLQALNDSQSLVVRWPVNQSWSVTEIQISRTEDHIIIYNESISAHFENPHEYKWTSDLPLECVDHFVRLRHFYNRSVPSAWSEWVTNRGVDVKRETSLFPSGRTLSEGSDATFCCVPPAGVDVTSMSFNNAKHPLLNIGTRVKAITVKNLRIPETFFKFHVVMCTVSNGTNKAHLYPMSFPPQKPRNLSCFTSHMITVTCNWDPGRERHPNDHNKKNHTLLIENSDQTPIRCEPTSCTFPVVAQLEEYHITVVVKDQLGQERESYRFNISERVLPMVEWDNVSTGGTNASLSWIIEGNFTATTFHCQIKVMTEATTEVNCSSANAPCKVKLEHLLPNTHYSTSARCSVNGRLWGEWTQPIAFTTSPLVTLNLWRRIKNMSDSQDRQVLLLWTPEVPGSGSNVTIHGYSVHWRQNGRSRTLWTDGAQTQAEVSIGPGQCAVSVKASLETGSSVPAHIIIPKMDDRETLPEDKRLSSSSAGGFNLSWTELDTATCGYVVEWCIEGKSAAHCTLQWKKTPGGNNTLLLPAGHFRAGRRYRFNIYGCTERGHRLLDILTGYSQELGTVPSPVVVEPVQTTSSSVTLEWRYNEDHPAHVAFITGYLVVVEETGSQMKPHPAAADVMNVPVAGPQTKSVTIEGLKHGHEYTFSVSAVTKQGSGPPARITVRTRINYAAQLVLILVSILSLLGCTGFLWFRRKPLKRRLTEAFVYPAGMDLRTAELRSFLQQTDEMMQFHTMEECISCHVEILNFHPEKSSLRDPFVLNAHSPEALSPEYRPQLATEMIDEPAFRVMNCTTNRTYFHFKEEDISMTQDDLYKSSVEPSEHQLEPCNVTWDYVSNRTL